MPRQLAQTAPDAFKVWRSPQYPHDAFAVVTQFPARKTLDVVRRRLVESHLKPVEVEFERLAFVTRAFFA